MIRQRRAWDVLVLSAAPLLVMGLVSFGCRLHDRPVTSDPKIINGRVIDPKNDPYPTVVAITHLAASTSCSATFVCKNVLMTAAHCFIDEKGNLDARGHKIAVQLEIPPFGVRLGKTAIIHPSYKRGLEAFDIALVSTQTDLGADPGAAIAPFGVTQTLSNGDDVTMIGYGIASAKEFDNPVMETPKRAGNAAIKRISQDIIWVEATASQQMVCVGDSGGPLLKRGADMRLHQIGVLSEIVGGGFLSTPPCSSAADAKFVSIAARRDWIDTSLKQLGCVPFAH